MINEPVPIIPPDAVKFVSDRSKDIDDQLDFDQWFERRTNHLGSMKAAMGMEAFERTRRFANEVWSASRRIMRSHE